MYYSQLISLVYQYTPNKAKADNKAIPDKNLRFFESFLAILVLAVFILKNDLYY